ncbi:septation protein SepH [Acidipropionibacterium jensenii]|uniref:septation protein SepH n=1 Tax=Acidipropionibacterium jensenii TaxID=1749 RepID=UPI00214D10D4|nr:septation protein SepH [Acidipropionibacterium jensenii]
MDSALSPREIQARIRSGASLDDVAAEAGVPTEQLEPFAVPVVAELDHIITTALGAPVRRQAEPGSHRSLSSVVAQVCHSHDIDPDEVHWRCWRHQDRSWELLASWQGEPGPGEGQASFRFDPRGRYSNPQDAGARWLVDDRSPLSGSRPTDPGAAQGDPDLEPTIDLKDELAIVRAVTDRPRKGSGRRRTTGRSTSSASSPSADAEPVDTPGSPQLPALPGMTQTDGVYDFAPSADQQMDMLYEMLAGFQEDSVNIYQGLEEPPVVGGDESPTADAAPAGDQHPDSDPEAGNDSGPGTAADESRPAPQPPADPGDGGDEQTREPQLDIEDTPDTAGPKPGGRRRKRGSHSKRASVPSWDEIMFGGPTPHV